MYTRATIAIVICALILAFLFVHHASSDAPLTPRPHLFAVQSIDTMKDSRDRAQQVLHDPSFDALMDDEMALIKDAGANYVAIGTPYDAQFIPVLARWVAAARRAGLNVWFRGNFSGWEGWFGYARITPAQHTQMLTAFLKNNQNLFQTGDIFSPCPECENGGSGDPRSTGDVAGFRALLANEARVSSTAFAAMDKSVQVVPSMNADVARVLLATDDATDRVPIVIDHYVSATTTFAADISAIARTGSVGLGEFGAPIPGINSYMTSAQQAEFVSGLLDVLYMNQAKISLVNYWTLRDSSTALSDQNLKPNAAYDAVKSYYTAPYAYGRVMNTLGEPLGNVPVYVNGTWYATTTSEGEYQVFLPHNVTVALGNDAYATSTMEISRLPASYERDVVLAPRTPDLWYRIRALLLESS